MHIDPSRLVEDYKAYPNDVHDFFPDTPGTFAIQLRFRFEPKGTSNMPITKSLPAVIAWSFLLAFRGAALAAEPPAVGATKTDATILAARPDDMALFRRSRIWYVLSQDNATGLLLGLPQRLGKVILPSRRKEPMWQGVDDGGSVKLVIERDGDAGREGDAGGEEGHAGEEIFVGFFSDPRWWLAEPAQVRSFSEPGNRLIFRADDLPPGKYWIGAMQGGLPRPRALGVHSTWPAPVEVTVGETTTAELRLSPKFQNRPAGQSNLEEGFAGQWPKMDPARTVTVRTADTEGKPVPFCSVVLFERDPKLRSRVLFFRQFGTDAEGCGYCDQLSGPFSISTQRFDFLPERMAFRYQSHYEPLVRELAGSKNVTISCDVFPTGTCEVSGRIYDSAGQPLTAYFLSLERVVGLPIERYAGALPNNVDYTVQAIRLPIIDADGRFTVDGLAPGDYAIEAMNFDSLRHVYAVKKRHIHLKGAAATATADIELEAREPRYGRAVFDDGKPVTRGGWIAPFNAQGPWRGLSVNFESDGSFRVLLSKSEREGLDANAKGLIEFRSYGIDFNDQKFAVAEARFDDLSDDPRRPTKVVLEWPDDQPAASAADAAPKPPEKWKLAVGARPDFKLVDTAGQTRRLSDYRGKVVWINFFGTGCAPCLAEWPHLVELSKEHKQAGLTVLAICPQAAEIVEEFARHRQPLFTVLVDEKQTAVAEFLNNSSSLALPTNILIDRDGRIAHLSEDFTDDAFGELSAKARELLARQPVAGGKVCD